MRETPDHPQPKPADVQLSYADIMKNIYDPSKHSWSDVARVPWLKDEKPDPTQNQFISYDDQRSNIEKINYVKSKGLGGVIIWELGGGYRPSPEPDGFRDCLLQSVKAAALNPPTTISLQVSTGWNMVGIPDVVSSFVPSVLWGAGAIVAPFRNTPGSPSAYENGDYAYTPTSVSNGMGYWVKFPSSTSTITYNGNSIGSMCAPVAAGWNIIGSISQDLPTSQVQSSPAGIVNSSYFAYNGSYITTTTLTKGGGYWVSVSQNGTLLLKPSSQQGGGSGGGPPITAPSLQSPANASLNQPIPISLSWSQPLGASTYRLQVSTQSAFTTTVYDAAGLTATSQQVGGLAYTTTYYWRANASNGFNTSSWSEVWSFTTQSPPPPPCNCCPQMAPTQITITDALGNHQTLLTQIGATSIQMPPTPPAGVLDVRFQSGDYLQGIPLGQAVTSVPFIVRNAVFPITLSWSIPAASGVTDLVGLPPGTSTDSLRWIPLSGSGSIDQCCIDSTIYNTINYIITQACPPPSKNHQAELGNPGEDPTSLP
ncbi:MAG: hypothetical protein E6K56_07475 [Ignavibacteria bacterium]|nr:MAG: hypothetical protein E6K56_07475 [Ignavibacteria bacterium]